MTANNLGFASLKYQNTCKNELQARIDDSCVNLAARSSKEGSNDADLTNCKAEQIRPEPNIVVFA